MHTAEEFITANLNEPQRQAVLNIDGPVLILAGAGSGKTKALTHRIANLIHNGVQPWEILAVTFTNKAATEMKERIENILHITEGQDLRQWDLNAGKLPVMGTFHSICARILRKDIDKIGRDRTFVIYDSDDQQRLMKEILKEMGVDDKELKPKAALGYVGRFKCEALSPKQAEAQATTPRMHQVITAYKRYQKALFECNALDFDDLMLETVKLFTEVPEVLEKYQNTWKYLHVDEYQDTNHAQYLFISLLAKKHQNLCVIGDPDQSIYAFRGADIRNILEFEKEYPKAKRIKLEQNYRSTQIILDAADGVIDANPNRPEKKMWSEQKEGPKVIIQEVGDEKKEALEAIKAINDMKQKHNVRLNEQVILYRTNSQSRLFEEACLRYGIPYRIVGGVKFYARKEVKDVLAYLHVILNPYDTVSLLRIINVPARKIGLTTIGRLQAHASQHGLSLWDTLNEIQSVEDINGPTKERLMKFTDLIEKYRTKSKTEVVGELTSHLLHAIDLEHFLRDDTEEGENRWGNVQELLSVMRKYDTLEPENSLISFLEEVSLVSEVDNLSKGDDAVTLMTLHLCKGLEFDHVIIGGCEENIFPHSNSAFDKEQLEEERRLMYVGMTRARKHLRLMVTRSRMLWGQTQANAPSRFLDDVPDHTCERRSDEVLSAFAWASQSGAQRASGGRVEPFRQAGQDLQVEFNQDMDFSDEFNQDTQLTEGCRVNHPTFGNGRVIAVRGDIVDIKFDNGQRKTLALSIAPLKIIG